MHRFIALIINYLFGMLFLVAFLSFFIAIGRMFLYGIGDGLYYLFISIVFFSLYFLRHYLRNLKKEPPTTPR